MAYMYVEGIFGTCKTFREAIRS